MIGIRRRGLRGRPFSVSVHRIERRGEHERSRRARPHHRARLHPRLPRAHFRVQAMGGLGLLSVPPSKPALWEIFDMSPDDKTGWRRIRWGAPIVPTPSLCVRSRRSWATTQALPIVWELLVTAHTALSRLTLGAALSRLRGRRCRWCAPLHPARLGEDARIWLERQGLTSSRKQSSPGRSMAARALFRRKVDLGAEARELTDKQSASAEFARATFERAQPIDGVPEVADYLAARGGLEVRGCESDFVIARPRCGRPSGGSASSWHTAASKPTDHRYQPHPGR